MEELRNLFKKGEITCLIKLTLRVIGGKWKSIILWHLGKGEVLRYGELRRACGKITHKMLTQELRELESLGMVNRKEYYQIPPKVEYSLSEKGLTVMPLLQNMHDWGRENILEK